MLRKRVARIRIPSPGLSSNIWTAKPDWIPTSHFTWQSNLFFHRCFSSSTFIPFIHSSTFETKESYCPDPAENMPWKLIRPSPPPDAWNSVVPGTGWGRALFMFRAEIAVDIHLPLQWWQVVLKRELSRLSSLFLPKFLDIMTFFSVLISKWAFLAQSYFYFSVKI